jgi:hypothetical protein
MDFRKMILLSQVTPKTIARKTACGFKERAAVAGK